MDERAASTGSMDERAASTGSMERAVSEAMFWSSIFKKCSCQAENFWCLNACPKKYIYAKKNSGSVVHG